MADAPGNNPLADLLSIRAAGEVMELSDNSIYRLISDGKLAALRHGGKSWIERVEITDYFARLKSEAGKRRAERAKARRPSRGRSHAEVMAG